jgi:hypothetical protein
LEFRCGKEMLEYASQDGASRSSRGARVRA